MRDKLEQRLLGLVYIYIYNEDTYLLLVGCRLASDRVDQGSDQVDRPPSGSGVSASHA